MSSWPQKIFTVFCCILVFTSETLLLLMVRYYFRAISPYGTVSQNSIEFCVSFQDRIGILVQTSWDVPIISITPGYLQVSFWNVLKLLELLILKWDNWKDYTYDNILCRTAMNNTLSIIFLLKCYLRHEQCIGFLHLTIHVTKLHQNEEPLMDKQIWDLELWNA